MQSVIELYEFVNKSKLHQLINSGALKEQWNNEDLSKFHKSFNTRNYIGELDTLQDYYNSLDEHGMIKITYVKNDTQSRYKLPNCLSSMRRVVRNYIVNEDYYDFDMVNSCATIILHLGLKHSSKNLRNLKLYVNNRQKWFDKIKKEFKCDNKKAKEIMTSITFGANMTFKDEELNAYKNALTFIQTELKQTELYNFIQTEKSGLSWLAKLTQSIESDIVSGLLNHIIVNYPELTQFNGVNVATYEMDGFKLLKQNVDNFGGENAVLQIINNWLIDNQYNTSSNSIISFISKNMDEKLDLECSIEDTKISSSSPSPVTIVNTFSPIIIEPKQQEQKEIKITLEDLERGERHIADLIYPIFENCVKYYEYSFDGKCIKNWYSLDKRNLWVESIEPPRHKIIKKLQELIDIEKNNIWEEYKKETNEDQKKILKKMELLLGKYYSNVGKSSFSNTLCNHYLCYNLQDNSFPKKLNTTIGKLVFNDGILDLKTSQFKFGFEPDDYITTSALISHNYLSLNPSQDKMEDLKKELKKICNNSDTDFEYTFSIIGYSFTGDAELEKSIYYLVDGTEDKRGDNGKTFIFSICGELFPELVKLSDPEMLEEKYTKAYKHIATWKNKRIVYFDEGTQKKLNGKLIKKIGDGKYISNEIMFGCVEEIKVYFKMFVCSNHIPKIENDEAVFNRYIQLEFASHFDRTGELLEDNPDKLEFIANPKLSQKIVSEYKDEFISLIINYATKYYREGLPPIPNKFIEASKQTKISNNTFAKWFFENYESSSVDDKISLDNIIENYTTQITREDAVKELKKIKITFNKDLTGFGTKINDKGKKVYIKGGISGWKMRQKEEEEEAI